MRVGFLMLDNSFGPRNQYYSQGVEKTWIKNIKQEDFYFRYVGRRPRVVPLNLILNRFIVSRFKNICTKYHLIRHQDAVVKGQFLSEKLVSIDVEELWSNLTAKTISAIDFAIKNYEFEFVIRGNSSLYLNTNELERFLETNATRIDYAGPAAKNKSFISGWCIILSRSAAQILVDNFEKGDSFLFDDEAIGMILRRNGVEMHPIKFEVFDRIPTTVEVEESINRGNWIWRFKDDLSGNRITIPAMKQISQFIANHGHSS